MMEVGEAVSAFFARESKSARPDGKISIDLHMALEVMAGLAGAMLFAAPADQRKGMTENSMKTMARHAGYEAEVQLSHHQ